MANAWGRRLTYEIAPKEETENFEGEECNICCANTVTVSFRPCNHVACKDCVDNLRRNNIFRADAGVKCPYCRSYIESYMPLDRTTSLPGDLREANLAARNAAIARGGKPQPSVQTAAVPAGHTSLVESWQCTCGQTNTNFKDVCVKCSNACPASTVKAVDKKDIMQCSTDEILQRALEKMHPGLDKAFAEAGMPIGPSSAIAGNTIHVGGSSKMVHTAVVEGGLERLRKVISALVDNGHVHTLIFHWFGNYTLQDLVIGASRVRTVAQVMWSDAQEEGGRKPLSNTAMQSLLSGNDDLLGPLIREIAKVALPAAVHKQGTYALQKVLESPCSAHEFVLLGRELMKSAQELLSTEPGIYVMAKLVEQLSSASATDMDSQAGEEASQILDDICELYATEKVKYMDSQRFEKLRYDMLISALDGALPKQHSAVLAVQIGSNAIDIIKRASGRFLIKSLMRIPPVNRPCREIMSNVCCHVAHSLEQGVNATVLKVDDRPPHVVSVLTAMLNRYNDYEWLETVIQEMVEGAEYLKTHVHAMDILKNALGQPGLSMSFLEDQFKELRQHFGFNSSWEAEVHKIRQDNLQKEMVEKSEAAAASQAAAAAASALLAAAGPSRSADAETSQHGYPPLGTEPFRHNAHSAQPNGANAAAQAARQPASVDSDAAPRESSEPEIPLIPFSGRIPDFFTKADVEAMQRGIAAGKPAPPGFEQSDGLFGSSGPDSNGVAGPSDATRAGLIAASPLRQTKEPYQPGSAGLYPPPLGSPPPAASGQEQAHPLLSFIGIPGVSLPGNRPAAFPRMYNPPPDAQSSGRTSPGALSPQESPRGQAPLRAALPYMPHLAPSGQAAPRAEPARAAPRHTQEYYNPPAARNATSARAEMLEMTATTSDGWGDAEDPSELAQRHSQMNPFVAALPLTELQHDPMLKKPGMRMEANEQSAPSHQHRSAAANSAAPQAFVGAAPAPSEWTCPTCTFKHEGPQAKFLACAVCGSVRKE